MPGSRRQKLALAIFVLLTVDRLEPRLLQLPFMNRAPLQERFDLIADEDTVPYRDFLRGVHDHTRPGDAILIVFPARRWDDGYSYAYYRAHYFLSGRVVLPLFLNDNVRHPENVRAAKYLAVWGRRVPPNQNIVWSGSGGVLIERPEVHR